MTGLRNPVGTHVRAGPGLVKGTLKGARELGIAALQVFTGNPRGSALSKGRPAEDAAFLKAGICLDTCHALAAGAPLDVDGGTTATLDPLLEDLRS